MRTQYTIRKLLRSTLAGFALVLLFLGVSTAQVERIWLTHPTNKPDTLAINWETVLPGNSVVHYGTTEQYDSVVVVSENTRLHQVKIALSAGTPKYHYQVATNDQQSLDYTFPYYPTGELRVAVVADWQGKPALDKIVEDNIHLLLTAGDNIPNLHSACGVGVTDCIEPYRQLIDTYPELFRGTPFMPVLGNHDREIRPRGKEPPVDPVYDIEASAFRRFFALPDDEWKWSFTVPAFDVRFAALDLSHTEDQGNSWQTCHAFGENSAQYLWYRNLMAEADEAFIVTLQNEKNERVRQQVGGKWHQLFRQGTAVITGYGYFAERAEKDGFPYFNTSLNGTGDAYPDTNSKFFQRKDSYILLTFSRERGTMTVEIKDHHGMVLDRSVWTRQ